MSDGCSMPSFLVVGCSIRASLTCLFFFKFERWEGDTILSTARVLRPSFSNFNRSPTYCTITAGRRIHTIISGRRSDALLRASFTCLFKKNFERREGIPHPLPYPPPARCFAPRLVRQVGLCAHLHVYFPLDPPLDGCGLTTVPHPPPPSLSPSPPHISKQIFARGSALYKFKCLIEHLIS